jgi:hypothetical protein
MAGKSVSVSAAVLEATDDHCGACGKTQDRLDNGRLSALAGGNEKHA